MAHTLELDDIELTALVTHFEGQSEMMNESRLNIDPHTPDREKYYRKWFMINVFTKCIWDQQSNLDFEIQNQDFNIIQNKLYPQVYKK